MSKGRRRPKKRVLAPFCVWAKVFWRGFFNPCFVVRGWQGPSPWPSFQGNGSAMPDSGCILRSRGRGETALAQRTLSPALELSSKQRSPQSRLWVTYRISVSAFAIRYPPRSADSDCRDAAVDSLHSRSLNRRTALVDFTNRFGYRSRRVRAWGSRASRRPAPMLACRCTPGSSSACRLER